MNTPQDSAADGSDPDAWRALLNRVFHESPIGISLTAPNGQLTRVNAAFAAMLGYDREELQRKGFVDVTHPDDVAASLALVRSLIGGTGSTTRIMKRYVHKDGHLVWADVSTVLLRDGAGQPLHFVTHVVDITGRQSAENRFRTVFDNSIEAVFIASSQGVYIDANKAACEMLRCERDQLIGKTMADITVPDDRVHLPARIEALRIAGRAVNVQRLRRFDGDLFYGEIVGQVQPDGTLMGLVRDVTAQVREQAVLRARVRVAESERTTTLDTLLQLALQEAEESTDSQIGFFHFVDEDQNLLHLQTWSRRTLETLCTGGKEGEHYPIEVAGVWADCVRSRQPVIHNDYDSLTHKKGLPDGHAPVHRELTVPVLRGDRVVAVIGVGNKATDYTHDDVQYVTALANSVIEVVLRRRAEDQLRQHRDHLDELVRERTLELARSNRELEQFAVIASHDLKEPLRKIQTFGGILANDFAGALNAEGRAHLERMTAGAARLQHMIDSLLTYSRVTTRAKPFVAVPLDAIAASVVSELEPLIVEVNAVITVEPLPVVWGDQFQLQQVIQNLVDNALKFVPAERRPQILVSGKSDSGRATLVVQDNGIGIDPRFRGKIFGMFQRLHAASTYEGSGIGLALCQKIVERHGGSIRVEGEPGLGSRFLVELAAVDSVNPEAISVTKLR